MTLDWLAIVTGGVLGGIIAVLLFSVYLRWMDKKLIKQIENAMTEAERKLHPHVAVMMSSPKNEKLH
jgi:hypothetical protein